VKYAFIAEHRLLFSIRAMCRCLRVQPSGFYAWLKNPLSNRAQEDQRQTELIRAAWSESGRVYGYRKLHDDLADMGESCCPNRVARLTRLAGIRAQWPAAGFVDTEIGCFMKSEVAYAATTVWT